MMDDTGVGNDAAADADTCPPYQISCNGMCISGNDPNNCGGCGVKCPPSQVCWANGCANTCPEGLNACNGWCVDLDTDNDNCGMCGKMCPMGQGCVEKNCVNAKIFPPGPQCINGGPPINVGGGQKPLCTGKLAQTTFTYGICSCKDVAFESLGLVDGWDSSKGPYKPMVLGGGVGADQHTTGSSQIDIWGPLWSAATTATAIDFGGNANVYHDVHSGANIVPSQFACGRDAYVAGDIIGDMSIKKTLYQSPGKQRNGNVTYGALDTSKVITVPLPCDCVNKIPVVAIVAWGKTNNDNAKIGLDPGLLTSNPPARVDLPCGIYYLTGFSLNGSTAIVVHGKTALLIDGSITANSFLDITLDPKIASSLDIFVSGTITTGAQFKLGSPAIAALTRLYIGGTQQLTMSSGFIVGGEIWAGNATVDWSSGTDAYGAVFAGNFLGTADVHIHHDVGVVKAGKECPPPPPMCGDCKDCGNQACINGKCDMCTNNGQCCPPLVCQNGTCVPPNPN